jgi:hypothetical protein
VRDRLRRSAARREARWCNNCKRDTTTRLKRHRATDECSQCADERLKSLAVKCERCDLPFEPDRLSLEFGSTIDHCTDQAALELRRLHAVHGETWKSVLLGGLGELGSRLRLGCTRLLIAEEQDAGAAMLREVLHKVGARLRIGSGCGEEREWNQR